MKKLIAAFVVAIALVGSVFACYVPPTCPTGSYLAGSDAVAYANSVVSTKGTVDNQNYAVGVDDNKYAVVRYGNPDPYMVLDMGEGEEVWDWMKVDVVLYGDSSDENANVYVSNDLTHWYYTGTVNSDETADLELPNNADSYRYIKVVNPTSNKYVEVDAVKGYCISNPPEEPEVPEFGTLGALAVLGLTGMFIYKKRK